jgi:mannose-6-phosphate isomerase-like protein (cupin superfamily)
VNIPHPFSVPVLPGKKSGFCKQRDQAPEEFGIEMKIVRNKMPYYMKEILTCFNIFLPAVLTKLTQDLGAAIQAIGLFTVFLMTHLISGVKASKLMYHSDKKITSSLMRIPIKDFIKKLPLPATSKWPEGVWDIEALRHGTMSLVLFTPTGKDYQATHDQDEIYIVVKGSGILVKNGSHFKFGEGDALFVPAGIDHHFEDFSDDLTLWAIFWGPKGGEENNVRLV